MTIHVGRPVAAAAPAPEEIRPSSPFAPRLHRNRTSASRRGRRTPPGRGSACSRPCRRGRRRAYRRPSSAWIPGLVRLLDLAQRGIDRRRGQLARSPPRAPASRRAGGLPSREQLGEPLGDAHRVGADRSPRRSARARSSRAARRRAAPARSDREPFPQRLRGRHVAEPQHGLGAQRGRRVRGRSSRSSRPPRSDRAARAAPGRSAPPGSGSRSRPPGRRARGRAPDRVWRPATISPRGCVADPLGERVQQSVARLCASAGTTVVSGRSPRPLSASSARRADRSLLGARRQRLPPRHVQVHGARSRLAAGGGERPAGDRAEMEQARVVGVVGPELAEPAHRRAVELQLVDRLAGADPSQLRRPVGGEHDQRHRRPRRPRPRPDGGWPRPSRRCTGPTAGVPVAWAAPSAKNPAERSSSSTADLDRPLPPERQRQRGRARTGGEDGAPDTTARQLLHHRRGECGVSIRRVHRPGR